MADVAPTQIDPCPSIASSGFICGATLGGSTGPGFDLKASVSSSQLLTSLTASDHSELTSHTNSRADLSKGELGAEAVTGYRHGAVGVAQFNDTLTFDIAGAAPTTLTDILISFTLDGELAGPGGRAGIRDLLRFGGANAQVYYNLDSSGLSSGFSQGGWKSYSWGGSTPGLTTFTGIYTLSGASQVLGIFNFLEADANSGGKSLYGHTSALHFTLPTGVTYSSASGVFLSATGGGVPEPATWTLMIAGFGIAGATLRQRRAIFA